MSHFEYPSQRYRDILERLAKGRTTREIADELCLSPWTIKAHRKHIYQALKVHNAAAAVVEAAKKGWIKL